MEEIESKNKKKVKKVAIISIIEEEINKIKNLMQDKHIIKIYELEFTIGRINNWECIIVAQCKREIINIARATQVLIDNFDLDVVINIGYACSVIRELEIGDILSGKSLQIR